MERLKINAKFFVLIVIIGFLLFYFRAWFHGFVMFFYINPVIFQVIVLTSLIYFLLLKKTPALNRKLEVQTTAGDTEVLDTPLSLFIAIVIFVFLLIFGLVFSNWLQNIHIAQNVDYVLREDLPESSENLRLMPYSVAQRYAKDSLQLSQYKLGTENIILIEDKMGWVFPLIPDGFIIQFLNKNKGIVYVDATQQSRNSENVWEDMEIGEGMYITDNLFWNVYRYRYFVDLDDPYYLVENGEILTCLGAISYSYNFKYGILYTVPNFEGVFTINTEGGIDLVSPEESLEHPILSKNRIFPEKLARKYTEAYEYHLGVLNKLFIHEDQIQIQDVADIGPKVNRQPYLMDTDEGLKWFISAEPYGASHGIFKIFVIDAKTGNFELYELPADDILTGPVKSVDYVRRSNPIVDWNRFDSVEPLPFIAKQRLFWKLTVIPADSAGIAYQAFVDAHTNDVFEFTQEEDIASFVRGEIEIEDMQTTAPMRESVIEEIKDKFIEIQELFEQLNL